MDQSHGHNMPQLFAFFRKAHQESSKIIKDHEGSRHAPWTAVFMTPKGIASPLGACTDPLRSDVSATDPPRPRLEAQLLSQFLQLSRGRRFAAGNLRLIRNRHLGDPPPVTTPPKCFLVAYSSRYLRGARDGNDMQTHIAKLPAIIMTAFLSTIQQNHSGVQLQSQMQFPRPSSRLGSALQV